MSLLRLGYKKTVVSVLPVSLASHLPILMKATALQRAPASTEPKDVFLQEARSITRALLPTVREEPSPVNAHGG